MNAASERLYSGEAGARYHEQREKLRRAEIQALRARFFRGFTSDTDRVLDFGCGTGGILSRLPAAKRIGIEVNEAAAAEAAGVLDLVANSTSGIDDNSIDRAISYHALEHIEDPSAVLRELRRVLTTEGLLRVLVPCDNPILTPRSRSWAQNPEMHLHSWTPLTLGNLITVTGFVVTEAQMIPASRGGRLASRLGEKSRAHRLVCYAKSIRAGHFHTMVTARVAGR
jgi:SAM-dependent methyltransferase